MRHSPTSRRTAQDPKQELTDEDVEPFVALMAAERQDALAKAGESRREITELNMDAALSARSIAPR